MLSLFLVDCFPLIVRREFAIASRFSDPLVPLNFQAVSFLSVLLLPVVEVLRDCVAEGDPLCLVLPTSLVDVKGVLVPHLDVSSLVFVYCLNRMSSELTIDSFLWAIIQTLSLRCGAPTPAAGILNVCVS